MLFLFSVPSHASAAVSRPPPFVPRRYYCNRHSDADCRARRGYCPPPSSLCPPGGSMQARARLGPGRSAAWEPWLARWGAAFSLTNAPPLNCTTPSYSLISSPRGRPCTQVSTGGLLGATLWPTQAFSSLFLLAPLLGRAPPCYVALWALGAASACLALFSA